MTHSRVNQWLFILLLGSFFLCVAYAFIHRIHPVVDAQAYDQIAVNLAEGYGFREDRAKSFESDHAMLRAGPGYEFFLAGTYTVFGHHYEAIWILQALLHVASAYLIYLTARRVFPKQGETAGLIAAALFAFWPDLIEISAMLMTETLYLFFTILTVYIFVRVFETSQRKTLAAFLGVATGMGILTRPPLLLFAFIFTVFYLRKKQYLSCIVYLLSLIAILTPWTLRNYAVYGQPILTTRIGEYNLWLGNTLVSDGGQWNRAYNPVTEFVDAEGMSAFKEKASSEFFSFLHTHPAIFLMLSAVRLIRYFSLVRPMGFWFYQSGFLQMAFVASSFFWIAGVFITGLSGMVTALKKRTSLLVSYLVVLALSAPVLLLPTVVQSRYRFQIYPFFAIFGGYAIATWLQEKGWWKRWVSWGPVAFLAIITFYDILLNFSLIVDRLRMFF